MIFLYFFICKCAFHNNNDNTWFLYKYSIYDFNTRKGHFDTIKIEIKKLGSNENPFQG